MTGALLDHEVLRGHPAPEGTKERKGIKVSTGSVWLLRFWGSVEKGSFDSGLA